ncbi:MAG: C25 family cysteine peptidase [candidate division WOR-3 bacterium]
MTRHVFAAFALLLVAGLASASWLPVAGGTGGARIAILEQNASRTVFEVTVPGLEQTPVAVESEHFVDIGLPGEVMAVLDEGKPQVPKVSVLLAIPTGAKPTARALVKETKRLIVGNVYPLQPPLIDGQEPGKFVFDRQFYSQDVSYPGYDVRIVETGVWRDLDVANIQVYPVQVNPARGEIEVASRIRVEVEYSAGTYPQTVADWMIPQYAQYIDNFNLLPVRPQDYSAGVRYLVIAHTAHSSNPWLTDSLMGWIKQRGYETRMIAKSSFTAQEIKDSIRAEYNRNTPKTLRFVLLVGEYAEIPMGSYSGVGRSDFWYSDLEPWPSGDNYPEIALGRFSPDSAGDLANQIKKTLKYQKNPPSTANWLEKIRMPTHKEQYPGKYSGCTRGIYFMPKPYYPTVNIDTIMGQFRSNADVTTAINAGVGIVAYRGHGDYTEWWQWEVNNQSWYNSHVDALTNGDMTPVVYNIACNCGDIYQAECLSERWQGKYPGGAVGNFGATQASYTLPNHGICSTLVRATTDTWTITVPGVRNYGPTVYNLAEIKQYGVDAYVAKYWPSSPYPYNIWMYVVLGDPALPVWTGGMPQNATVTRPDSIPLGPYTLNVTVEVGGRPVEGALVCAWKEPDFYVAERTDASGLASLDVNAATAGEVLLTVSEGHAQHSTPGAQHTPILPYEATIRAGGGGTPMPNMRYVSNQVLDPPPGGNNNGRFDPGETGNILVTVRNAGNAQANNVTAVLKSGHAQFVITDPNAVYGNVPAGEQRTNTTDPFTATAGSGIPGGTMVPCTLKLHCDNWGDWTYTFSLQVGEPPMPGMLLMDHDTGYCKLTVSCQGSIGYDLPPADMGSGFCYPKSAASALFYGSVAVGNAETYVADRHFSQPASGTPNTDLVPVDSLRPVVPPVAGDEHFRGSYSDAGHPSAKGLKITQNSYQVASSGYDDFVVVVTDIANNGSSAVNGLYAGVFADFDVGSTPTANVCSSDVSRRFTFMRQTSSANPCVGVKILAPTSYANLAAVDHARYVYPDSAMTDGMKWRFLNGTVVQPNSNRAYDWSVCVSVGPFNLPVGASQRFAFAFCGGADGAQARAHADSAQSWYDRSVGLAEGPVRPGTSPHRVRIQPNPVTDRALVRYHAGQAGLVRISLSDATGRTIATLFSGMAGPGPNEFVWDPGRLAAGVYFLRLEAPDVSGFERVVLAR